MSIKAWKLSASIVIAVKSSIAQRSSTAVNRSNIQILTLRRGQDDKHLPGTHVFPGGNLDKADANPRWLELYKSSGFDLTSFQSISDGNGFLEQTENGTLPGWMSLRLCAIRETFEESGILLCRAFFEHPHGLPWTKFSSRNGLDEWQKRVREDPDQLMTLCQATRCVPDVWGLHLWSNWLTPVQQRVRHNAYFFLSVLPTMPQYSLDNLEMDELKWCTAVELIESLRKGNLRLPNPQFYEASRLSTFRSADELAAFAAQRAVHGSQCVMPVQESAKDGFLFVLPGDARYAEDVDFESPRKMTVREKSLAELREEVLASNGSLHRIEIPKANPCPKLFVHKYVPPCQHVLPLGTDQLCEKV